MPDSPPLIEGKYEILEKLGEGGMGAIYKVHHRLLEEVRVVKFLRSALRNNDELRARFVREARLASQLRHPNIAQLYDFTIDDLGNSFIVMEFIQGITLEELVVRNGPIPLPAALELGIQALAGIGYLHRRKLIHRDISLDNLMLTQDLDQQLQLKLIDLGIAKTLEGQAGLTSTGMFLGKLRYSSPEQLRGGAAGSIDGRSDLYSFTVAFCELLTGTLPIRGDDSASLIAGHLHLPPIPFEESDPQDRVPQPVRELLLRGLSKEPGDRFDDAVAMAESLEQLREDYPLPSDQARDLWRLATSSPSSDPPRPEAGSTQGRLDDHFGLETTPAAGSHRVEPVRQTLLRPEGSSGSPEPPRKPVDDTHPLDPTLPLDLRSTVGGEPDSDSTSYRPWGDPTGDRTLGAPGHPQSFAEPQAPPEAAVPLPHEVPAPSPQGAEEPEADSIASITNDPTSLLARDVVGREFQQLDATLRHPNVTEEGPPGDEPSRDSARVVPPPEPVPNDLRAGPRRRPSRRRPGMRRLVGGSLVVLLGTAALLLFRESIPPNEDPAPGPLTVATDTDAGDRPPPSSPPDHGTTASSPTSTNPVPSTTPRENTGSSGLSSNPDDTARIADPEPRDTTPPPAPPPVVASNPGAELSPRSTGAESQDDPGSPDPEVTLRPGVLQLDARPWARLTRLRRLADETEIDLGEEPITPLRIDLPPGRYRLSLSNPPLGADHELEVEILPGQATEEQVVLTAIDIDRYFSEVGW